MCGVAGIWRPGDRRDDRRTIASILQSMASRGPDSEGTFQEGPLTLGHRRLAIIDLSEAARQPMISRSGRLVVSFNGEIYNYRELRDLLGLHPSDLRSTGDTEVLLEAWERWGPQCLDRLVGPFAFALYDREKRTLWLVRDRVGEKPLFHHQAQGVLTFASSIPALLRADGVGRRLDRDSLAEYMTLRYVVPPRTVVEGVAKLRPGHLLEVDDQGVRERRWWKPPLLDPEARATPASRGEAVERFGALLEAACRRCLVSDVPCGLLLSDGIDSNSIRAVLQEDGNGIASYTFRYLAEAGGPSPHPAGAPADSGPLLIGCDRRTIIDSMEPALSCLTEPVGDGSVIPTWLLIRAARPRSTVFLCGHGGDEVLGGYRMSQERFRLSLLRWAARMPATVSHPVTAAWTHGSEPIEARRRMFARSTADDWPTAVRYLIHHPLPPAEVEELTGVSAEPDRYLAAVDRLYADCPAGLSDLDRMQYVLLETFFAANLLPLADSVSMAHSAELRMPFVDRDLVEYVLSLPRGFRVAPLPGHANTKLVLRDWARAHLPRTVVERKKGTFRYGGIRLLLRERTARIRERICDATFLRQLAPGLEGWTDRAPDSFHGEREGTLWALLTLAVWGAAAGLVAP